jgi:hypothetical protein
MVYEKLKELISMSLVFACATRREIFELLEQYGQERYDEGYAAALPPQNEE